MGIKAWSMKYLEWVKREAHFEQMPQKPHCWITFMGWSMAQHASRGWRVRLQKRCDFDAVTSPSFRHIERRVGLIYQLSEFWHTLSLEPCNAETRGHLNGFRGKGKVMLAKLAQNTRHDGSNVAFVSMGKYHDEFLSARPAADVRIPETCF